MRRGALLLAGVALGFANSLTSALGSPYSPWSLLPGEGVRPLEYLAAWLGTGWAWSLFAFGVGWVVRPLRSAIAGATAGLLLADLAYFLTDAALGVTPSIHLAEVALWAIVALVVGPVMASAGWAARRPSRWSVLPALAAPAVMVLDTVIRPTGPDSIRPTAQWLVYLAAAALAAGLVGRERVRPGRGRRGSGG